MRLAARAAIAGLIVVSALACGDDSDSPSSVETATDKPPSEPVSGVRPATQEDLEDLLIEATNLSDEYTLDESPFDFLSEPESLLPGLTAHDFVSIELNGGEVGSVLMMLLETRANAEDALVFYQVDFSEPNAEGIGVQTGVDTATIGEESVAASVDYSADSDLTDEVRIVFRISNLVVFIRSLAPQDALSFGLQLADTQAQRIQTALAEGTQ